MDINNHEIRPAGYAYLLNIMKLAGIPNWHISFVSISGTHKSKLKEGNIEEIYPKRYWPGEGIGEHLEFALKYDGINFCFSSSV